MGDTQSSDRERLEREVQDHAAAGRFDDAATCALQGYGPELLGFLRAVIIDPSDADDAFSLLCESAWAGLPRFRMESTVRTWLYSVARNVARDQRRAKQRRQRRVQGLDTSAAGKLAAHVRSTTAIHLKTQTKNRLHEIRDALPPQDRMLLVLRLDREMAWSDIARVLSDDAASEEDVTREAARLRKRFERVKAKLAEQLRSDLATP